MSTVSNTRNSKRPSEATGWSQADIELVEQNRRAAMEEWDEFPNVFEAAVPPKDWVDSIWLKLGTGALAIPAFYIVLQGWGV